MGTEEIGWAGLNWSGWGLTARFFETWEGRTFGFVMTGSSLTDFQVSMLDLVVYMHLFILYSSCKHQLHFL